MPETPVPKWQHSRKLANGRFRDFEGRGFGPGFPHPCRARIAAWGRGGLLLLLVRQPGCNVVRGDKLSRNVRIDCAREDNQSLLQLGTGEVLGFRFGLECGGQARASPFRQDAALMHFIGHIPGRLHRPPMRITRCGLIEIRRPLVSGAKAQIREPRLPVAPRWV